MRRDDKLLATEDVDALIDALGDGESACVRFGPIGAADPMVEIRVRRRAARYHIDDNGAAVDGHEHWRPMAERVAAEFSTNVNRRGVLFVPRVSRERATGITRTLASASHELAAALDRDAGLSAARRAT